MVKMLLLDGPLAGQTVDLPRHGPYMAIAASRPMTMDALAADFQLRQVAYMPHRVMLFSRIIVVGCCGDHDRRELEQLMFRALVTDAAQDAAGPMEG